MEQRGRNIPVGRAGQAEDIAAAVAFLASPEAAYITAQAIPIDGGGLSPFPLRRPEPEAGDPPRPGSRADGGHGAGGGPARPAAHRDPGVPPAAIGPDDGLLRIEANGICGSDVESTRATCSAARPVVPGHEPLGIIEEIGERAAERWGVSLGDRVALEILVPCRPASGLPDRPVPGVPRGRRARVHPDHPGRPRFGEDWPSTPTWRRLDLHPIDKDLPAELAVMFNPLGAGVRWAVHLGGVGIGSTVLVLGAGSARLVRGHRCQGRRRLTVIVTGLAADEHKLALARQFGADHTIVVDEATQEAGGPPWPRSSS